MHTLASSSRVGPNARSRAGVDVGEPTPTGSTLSVAAFNVAGVRCCARYGAAAEPPLPTDVGGGGRCRSRRGAARSVPPAAPSEGATHEPAHQHRGRHLRRSGRDRSEHPRAVSRRSRRGAPRFATAARAGPPVSAAAGDAAAGASRRSWSRPPARPAPAPQRPRTPPDGGASATARRTPRAGGDRARRATLRAAGAWHRCRRASGRSRFPRREPTSRRRDRSTRCPFMRSAFSSNGGLPSAPGACFPAARARGISSRPTRSRR